MTSLTCFCSRPFHLPDPWILFGCPCGEIWRRGIDRYGYTVWRNRIGVTAKALPVPRGEGISEGVSKRSAV
jgi:hypothetical protein